MPEFSRATREWRGRYRSVQQLPFLIVHGANRFVAENLALSILGALPRVRTKAIQEIVCARPRLIAFQLLDRM